MPEQLSTGSGPAPARPAAALPGGRRGGRVRGPAARAERLAGRLTGDMVPYVSHLPEPLLPTCGAEMTVLTSRLVGGGP